MRSESRLPIVRRAAGSSRDDCALGSTSDGVSWNVSTPKVCSTTRPTSDESDAGDRARRTLAQELLLRRDVGVVLHELDVLAGRDVAEQQAEDLDLRQRRIGLERRRQPIERARGARDHAVGLAGHAHARLGLDVEERLDPRRVVEVDRAARHLVAPAFEGELAAVDFRAAEQQRTIVGAAQLQIGVGEEPRGAVPDFERRRRDDPHVVAERQRRGGERPPPPPRRRRSDGQVEQAAAFVERPRVQRVPHVDGARQRQRVDRPLHRQVRVDERPHALGEPQAHAVAGDGHVDPGRLVPLDLDPAAEPDRAAAEPRGHLIQADAAGVEAQRPGDVLERVRQVEVTDAAVVDVHRAADDRIAHRALERGLQRRAARAADVRHERLEDAEARVAGCADRHPVVVQIDQPFDVELRLVADQAHLGDTRGVPIERQANRRGVAQAVVEQPEIEPLDRRLHQQLVDVRELADDAHVAAGDRRSCTATAAG